MNVKRYADVGLHGWKGKAGRELAARVAPRTPLRAEHLQTVFGALAFALSLRYVLQTLLALKRAR